MNNSIKMISLTVAFAASMAAAGPIAERNWNQQERIAQGRWSGQLTPRETARLERDERQVHNVIVRDRISGGRLSWAESAQIDHLQNRVSRDIYVQKHDAQCRR